MKKLLCLLAFCMLLAPAAYGQGVDSTDIYQNFRQAMKSDVLTFPDSVIYKCIRFSSELACHLGLAYPKVDTITLATGTIQYGLEELAIWVYRVGKITGGERSWQALHLSNFGKYATKERISPNYYDAVNEMEGVTNVFGAGSDTTYLYLYPQPTTGDNGDTITVHYFAWDHYVHGNVRAIAEDMLLNLSLMMGYIRAGRSDKAVESWNMAAQQMDVVTNYWLQRIYNIEVVPTKIGGGQ